MSGGNRTTRRHDRWTRRLGLSCMGLLADVFSALSTTLSRIFGRRSFGWVLPAYAWTMIVVLLLPIILLVPMAFTDSTFIELPLPDSA